MSIFANIQNFASDFGALSNRIETSALLRYMIEQKQRIFGRGECVDGSGISSRRKAREPREGDYSRSHGRKRREKGKQTSRVDLSFTGRHKNSLQVGTDNSGNTVYGFLDQRNRKIAEGHTDYRDKNIYGSSDREIELAKKTAVAEIRAEIKQYFNAS